MRDSGSLTVHMVVCSQKQIMQAGFTYTGSPCATPVYTHIPSARLDSLIWD